MSGGAGGGRRGGTDPEVTSGKAKVTHRWHFGAAGKTLAERQEGWRDKDNLAVFGGWPLRGGSAACTSCGAWQGLRRWVETVSILEPIWTLKKCSALSNTKNGPSYSGDSGGWTPSWWTNTNQESNKSSGSSAGKGMEWCAVSSSNVKSTIFEDRKLPFFCFRSKKDRM